MHVELQHPGPVATGWFGGGNRRRFEAMAADPGRDPLLGGRPGAEDEDVWLLPCLFVRREHRSQGVAHALVRAVVSLARDRGAVAVEGWPLEAGTADRAAAFVGREERLTELGFRRVERPAPGRVVVRLGLDA